MGLFGKLKGMKNALTGGAAEVTVEVSEAPLGGEVTVRVTAQARADFNVRRIYVQVRAVEGALVEDIDVARDGRVFRETVEGEMCTHDFQVELMEEAALSEGQTYTWDLGFVMPEDALPSFTGRSIRNTWMIRAGLDALGNDPDSGWVEFYATV